MHVNALKELLIAVATDSGWTGGPIPDCDALQQRMDDIAGRLLDIGITHAKFRMYFPVVPGLDVSFEVRVLDVTAIAIARVAFHRSMHMELQAVS